jgi:hypothetical protein
MIRFSPASQRRPTMVEQRPLQSNAVQSNAVKQNAIKTSAVQASLWQTPRGDGQRLIDPAASSWVDVAAHNRAALAVQDYDVQGVALTDLAAQARRQLWHAAYDATRAYRGVSETLAPTETNPLFLVAGHQPEIFHPGVWLKNALLSQSAAAHARELIAINLVIDSDLVKSTSLRVPGGTPDRPRWAPIAFDRGPAEVPWEMRAVADMEFLASWPERMLEAALPPARDASYRDYWPLLVERARATGNLGLALSQARHQLEGAWGWNTLELPISRAAELPAVRWLLAHLLAHLPRLTTAYNGAINAYRHAHGITSSAHPAPLLEERDGWIEAPFWLYDETNPRRRRVWARWQNDELHLSDLDHTLVRLPLAPDQPLDAALAAWDEFAKRGIKLRTKALITTLVARVLLGDLFMHGIGGAKYDAVTDQICEEFFGLPAPRYAVVSGTLRWPRDRHHETIPPREVLITELRRSIYNPEHLLPAPLDAATEAVIDQKLNWLETEKTPANARERHQGIVRANLALAPLVAARRAELQRQLEQLSRDEHGEGIMTSRELPFVVHSTERLRTFFAG